MTEREDTELEKWVKENVRYVHRAYYIHPMFLEKIEIPYEEPQEKNSKS